MPCPAGFHYYCKGCANDVADRFKKCSVCRADCDKNKFVDVMIDPSQILVKNFLSDLKVSDDRDVGN